MEADALRFAVQHAHSSHSGHGFSGYDTWLQTLSSGSIVPDGNPYAARLLREAREQAASFLTEIAPAMPLAESQLLEAAKYYRIASRAWYTYHQSAVAGGAQGMCSTATCDGSMAAIREAYAAEREAITLLERVLSDKKIK